MITPGAFEDRRQLEARLSVLRVGVIACLALLAIGFWILQIVQFNKYREIAENQHLRTIPLRAPRGVLYDRNGKVLVQNTYSWTIALMREQLTNPRNLDDSIVRLAGVTGADAARMADIVRRHRSDASFQPIAIIEHATIEQVMALEARKLEFPEFVSQKVPTREYPQGGFAAHLFGYVSEIQESQLERIEYAGLQSGAIVGQSGLERTYNPKLQGKDGARYVAVNSRGRELESRYTEEPLDGARLQLTIDYDMQHALEEGFKTQNYAGAAIFMDPRTGEVLAMTSQPEYDPNDFANGLEHDKWAQLMGDPKKPMTNRLLQGRYSPGSTFKILMATTALSEGVIKPETTFYCPGSATFYGRVFHCDKKEGHGTLDLRHAIEKSCNVYFYHVADLLKIDTIHKYAQALGLIGKTEIDLPGEIDSFVPSTEWKLKTQKDRWYPSETLSVGIGQGPVSVTPIALATMMATVANGGTVVRPHVAKAVDTGSGWEPLEAVKPKSLFPISAGVLGPVHDGLWMVVNGAGTGSRARIDGRDVSGKTGTAQVISNEGKARAGKTEVDLRDNAWFVFFAPRDNPEIAGVVFVEHAGHGGIASAPIAKYVLETYFAKKDHLPLPVWKPPLEVVTPPAAAAPPNGRGQ
jgi:penicillin-binding protein 2